MNDNTPAKTNETAIAPYVEETVQLLDPRAEGGIAVHDSKKGLRMWAATVSAGWKEPGAQNPSVVRDGKMRIHEDTGAAPGLKAALAKSDGFALTITMLSNNIADCMKQMLCSYGSVKVFGDHNGLTVMRMVDGAVDKKIILPSDPQFAKTLDMCKAVTFIPFALAEWTEGENPEPYIVFPDGYLPYRLRFGSVNSARVFVDSLQAIKRLTGGQLIGVPLHLSLSYQSKMYPDKKDNQLKRTVVPIWSPVLKHPKGIALGARQIQGILTAGIQDASQLALPAPIDMSDPEVVEAVLVADEKVDRIEATEGGEVTEAEFTPAADLRDIRTLTAQEVPGRRKDDYFRACQKTIFATDQGRPALVARMAKASGVEIDAPSLVLLCERATHEQWAICNEVMCKALAAYHGTEEPTKEAKPVITSGDPYAEQTPITKPANPVETKPVTGKKVEEPTKPAEVAPAPVEEKKPEEPAPKPTQAKRRKGTTPATGGGIDMSLVNNYVLLERDPTPAELDAATDWGGKHLTEAQFSQLVLLAGGINVTFVMMQARKKGITDFGDMVRLIDQFWDEDGKGATS